MTAEKNISFIGGGNMAEAILAGLIHGGVVPPESICVSEPVEERRSVLATRYGVSCVTDNAEATGFAHTLVLAVKPFKLDDVKEEIRAAMTNQHCLISILAGASREKLTQAFGHPDGMVRVMPNLPAQVGRGVSAVTFPQGMSEPRRDWVRMILRSVGQVVEVDEPLQDAVTAVSGSGPGFLFILAHHWIEAAIREGLSADSARTLVVETLAGSAEVLARSDDSPTELAKKVATPGGTTEAGLNHLAANNLGSVWAGAVSAARKRSQELAD